LVTTAIDELTEATVRNIAASGHSRCRQNREIELFAMQ
jgi:hypothetical protein